MIGKVSVIVPLYNVEKYLEECIESILRQSYRNIEIILVDDGSTDTSKVICDRYASTDDRIKVIHKSNGGISEARNVGLSKAGGDYILFLDSDDYILPNAIEVLTDHIQSYDFIHYEARNFDSEHELDESVINYYKKKGKYEGEYTGGDLLRSLLEQNDYRPPVQYYFFRHNFIKDNKLSFYEGIIYEDEEFMGRAFFYSEKCSVLQETLYMHRLRTDSITGTRKSRRNTDSMYHVILSMMRFWDEQNKKETYHDTFVLLMTRLVMNYYNRLKRSTDKLDADTWKKKAEIEAAIKNHSYYNCMELRKYVMYYKLYFALYALGTFLLQ